MPALQLVDNYQCWLCSVRSAACCVSAGLHATTGGAVRDTPQKDQCLAITMQQAVADSGSEISANTAEQGLVREQEDSPALPQEAARLQCQEAEAQHRQGSLATGPVKAEGKLGTRGQHSSDIPQPVSDLQQVHHLLCSLF